METRPNEQIQNKHPFPLISTSFSAVSSDVVDVTSNVAATKKGFINHTVLDGIIHQPHRQWERSSRQVPGWIHEYHSSIRHPMERHSHHSSRSKAGSIILRGSTLYPPAFPVHTLITAVQLVGAMKAYRGALSTVSHASAHLARCLEACSRLKGVSDDAGVGLQAAAGLHHVIANHEQVLVRRYL